MPVPFPRSRRKNPTSPNAGQPEVTPDAGKKVQKPEEVDTEATKAGIGMSEDANYAQKTYGHSVQSRRTENIF